MAGTSESVGVVPFWSAGKQLTGDETLEVTNPFDGRVVAVVALATPAQVDEAVEAAYAVRHEFAALPAYRRADALAHVSRRLAERANEIAELITAENGKPIKWARGEVARAISTFRFAAEEARRFDGGVQRLDTDAAGTGRLAVVRRFPKGVVLGISPFNFPLNLVAHKVAPAIAVGAPIILKPAPATPLSALVLGELFAETDLPAGVISVLPIPNDRAAALVQDPRLPVVSFTGSGPVGWAIKESVPRKHVTLELGGNAAVVVCADADLDHAAARIAMFSNYQGGQSCIAVQRVFIDAAVYDETVTRIVGAVGSLVTGAPDDERTDVGPLVDEKAAMRVAQWVDEAVAGGRHPARRRCTRRRQLRPDGARRRPRRCEGLRVTRCSAPCSRWPAVRRPRRRVREGQRLRVRPAGGRLHPRTCRPRSALTASSRWAASIDRRRAQLSRRPDALRRRQGIRRRPRGPAVGDGGLHRRARDGAHRPRPLTRPASHPWATRAPASHPWATTNVRYAR